MFIVANRGIRLRKSFWIWMLLAWVMAFGPGAVFLTLHIHYDPEPKQPRPP